MSDYEFIKGLIDPYIKYYDIESIFLINIQSGEEWTKIYFKYTKHINGTQHIRYVDFNLPEAIDPEAIKKVFQEASVYNVRDSPI